MKKKRNNKHEKRVKKLIVGCGLSAILLSVSTYAWFIGMQTVNVASFDISIATTDSLLLSLDGEEWSDNIVITGDTYDTASYENNTNSWGGKGLIPMSSVGKIDDDASRLILFEKGSFTATPGGYRLLASQVENGLDEDGNLNAEKDGYVAFDLFIKNTSGEEYYEEYDPLNEEAIYLTTDSAATVASTGVANTGIENSVRVAFAQIGRVVSTTTNVSTITGISCDGGSGVTTICSERDAQIWEPNDTAHVENAINWYDTSCKTRSGSDLTLPASYGSTSCGTVENGESYPTYAVSGVIGVNDRVDVYDGEEFNGYKGSIATTATAGKLVAYDYFTDSEKLLQGVLRPEFITLAPNSITKVRVYVYIEGQDIDNYDFASLGKKISVGFGFTKERFYGEDINYDDSNTATLPSQLVRTTQAD